MGILAPNEKAAGLVGCCHMTRHSLLPLWLCTKCLISPLDERVKLNHKSPIRYLIRVCIDGATVIKVML